MFLGDEKIEIEEKKEFAMSLIGSFLAGLLVFFLLERRPSCERKEV